MAALGLIDRRVATSNRRFDEMQAMYEAASGEGQHARRRLNEVRAERDEWKAKYDRGEITIAQLRERLKVCDAQQRALRELLRLHGIHEADIDRD
jgi:predicted  nucleic acid-binding Zn-ribbon protein